jgi:hydrogenase maturation protein HypF
VTGVVQGVGFRPFVYGLATRLDLSGWVRNTSAGVDIVVEGPLAALEAFQMALREEAPPLARIDALETQETPPNGYTAFEILHSEARPGDFQPISPDVATCDDCLAEVFDPADRRYRYAFTNCTNCGPRFTIIRDIPYDRPSTTMAPFRMCPACQAEYDDPLDRRFHAQPNACPVCGPQLALFPSPANPIELPDGDPVAATRALLVDGAIVAIKGLGGFHLACDATNAEAVARLRERKGRPAKPFALMAPDVAAVETLCHLDEAERSILTGRERPIVLLRQRAGSPVAANVAPDLDELGVMLPYTPLHHLLLEPEAGLPPALVMTSGNFSEEPIAAARLEAFDRLAPLADAFLMHNRAIHTRCDDSVVCVVGGELAPLRRSRGYAPGSLSLPFDTPPVLAVGPELKNTFCLARGQQAFVSQHIGDLKNYEAYRAFEDGVRLLAELFRVEPEIIAYDLHPAYLSTRYAQQRADDEGLAAIGVQHHHAHVAACMAEHGLPLDARVIGVSFDGTGYGTDGAIWGGEFLLTGYADFERVANLAYVPLPGGDAAIERPYRAALSYLRHADIEWDESLPPVAAADAEERAVVARMLERGFNVPLTSSMGRLFDAVASLAGVVQEVSYEAQAAIWLEARASDGAAEEPYPFTIRREGERWTLDPAPLIRAVVEDVRAGLPDTVIGARFHEGVARLVLDVCGILRDKSDLRGVMLSGGVFQNVTLLRRARELLEADGFTVYTHRAVPANDGGVALGQVAVAAARILEK